MGRLAAYFVPQPVEDCLEVLGGALLAGNALAPVLASASENLLGWDAGGDDSVRASLGPDPLAFCTCNDVLPSCQPHSLLLYMLLQRRMPLLIICICPDAARICMHGSAQAATCVALLCAQGLLKLVLCCLIRTCWRACLR